MLTAQLIEECVSEYSNSIDRFVKMVRISSEKIEKELKSSKIMARVSGRAKSIESLRGKLEKWSNCPDKNDRIKLSKDVFTQVGDLAALRVMTYVDGDRERVVDLIKGIFAHRDGHETYNLERVDQTQRVKEDEENFYKGTHMQICLMPEDMRGDNDINLKGMHCEVQITSMLSHVWNEIEHDIVYKKTKEELTDEEISCLKSLGNLTAAGDSIIVSLIDAHKNRLDGEKSPNPIHHSKIKSKSDLVILLESFYGNSMGDKFRYWDEANDLFKMLQFIEITKPATVIELINPSIVCDIKHNKFRKFKSFLKRRNSIDININGCDLFIVALFVGFSKTVSAYKLPGKRPRYAVLADQYEEFKCTKAAAATL